MVGQSSEHDADHCETDERRGGSRVALEVAGEAPTVADPGERSLDDPAFGKRDEAMQFIALDDRQLPGAGLGDGGRGLLPLVPGISEDKLDEGEEAACAPIEDEQSAVAILHSGYPSGHSDIADHAAQQRGDVQVSTSRHPPVDDSGAA